MRIRLKILRRWIVSSSTRPEARGGCGAEPFLLSVSEPSAFPLGEVETGEDLFSTKTSCSTRPSSTETMIAASSVSLKTIKKIGTENRFLAILEGLGREGVACFRL